MTTRHPPESARPFLPNRLTLPILRQAAEHCRGCDLYKDATQTVFGEGPRHAAVMFVGEAPGDQEDQQGEPFVGPAGHLLHQTMIEVGLTPQDAYITNAVKHFRFEQRGKRRLHQKPRWREIQACRPWLEAEIAVVEPQMIVCLGATAAQSLAGREFRITRQRGMVLPTTWGPPMLATYHPAAILRSPSAEGRQRMQAEFKADLQQCAERISR